jgi:hypothetical protein
MIRAIPSAFPVASSATSSSPPRLCANSKSAAGSVGTRPASRTSPPSAIATSQKSRCTSNPMNRIDHHLHLGRPERRRGGRHDNYGSVRTAHPDSRRGGHLQTAGSQPIMLRGLPNLRLPEAPGIRNTPTLRHSPDDPTAPRAQFHLPTTATGPTRRSSYRRPSHDLSRPPHALHLRTSAGATCSAASSTSTSSPPDPGCVSGPDTSRPPPPRSPTPAPAPPHRSPAVLAARSEFPDVMREGLPETASVMWSRPEGGSSDACVHRA